MRFFILFCVCATTATTCYFAPLIKIRNSGLKISIHVYYILILVIYWCVLFIVKLVASFVDGKYISCRIKTNVVIFLQIVFSMNIVYSENVYKLGSGLVRTCQKFTLHICTIV